MLCTFVYMSHGSLIGPSVGWEQARDCVCEGIGYSDNKKGVSYRVGTNVQLEHYTQFSHPFV